MMRPQHRALGHDLSQIPSSKRREWSVALATVPLPGNGPIWATPDLDHVACEAYFDRRGRFASLISQG
jgi:hypothetical protein